MPILTDKQFQRFTRKVAVNPDTGCINWTGAIKTSGYGCVMIDKKLYYVHRVAYEQIYGEIADGLVVDHTCHNKLCIAPNHLQAVTNKENAENRSWVVRASSGFRGVHYHRPTKKYAVRVRHEGKTFCGGSYVSAEEANEVAIALRNRLFTNNLLDRYATIG